MSTTKIFVVFGICVSIVIIPLSVLYICFPSILGRYDSIVGNIIVGLFGAYIVALALDFTLRRRQEKSLENIAKVGLTETSQVINQMLSFFASMIKASSNRYKPSNIDDLFSSEAAELISLHLALDYNAPVTSKIRWSDYIAQETCNIVDQLTSIQNRYQSFFPESVFTAIGTLQNNALFSMFKQFKGVIDLDKQRNLKRPVLNIIPQETLNALMNEVLICVKIIQKAAVRLESSTTPKFPSFKFREDVSPKYGEARYNDEPGVGCIIG